MARQSARLVCVLGLASVLAGFDVHAAGTQANTAISNTAVVSFENPDGEPQSVSSNPAVFRVAELVNLTLVSNDAGNVTVATPDDNRALSYTLTNTGNGSEAYALSAGNAIGGDQFDPVFDTIYLDADGNGLFDPAVDTPYAPGVNDPVLDPDQSQILFVVNDIPGGRTNGDVGLSNLTATALSGTGAPGTVLGGAGTGGVDAVIGSSGGDDLAQGGYVVSAANVSLSKSFSIADPFGGSVPMPGAVVTYSLQLQVTGTGLLPNAQIVDPIPANTTYVPGSIVLDGVAQTDDAGDADAGRFDTAADTVRARLGDLTPPATRSLSFQVRID